MVRTLARVAEVMIPAVATTVRPPAPQDRFALTTAVPAFLLVTGDLSLTTVLATSMGIILTTSDTA